MDLPVESLKIEGRMRSPRYVGTVVRIYREALDTIRDGQWEPTGWDEQELALAFNRGFTGGYAGGSRHDGIMGRDRPDHRGLLAGTVSSYDQARHLALVTLRSALKPEMGDGVVFHETGIGPGNRHDDTTPGCVDRQGRPDNRPGGGVPGNAVLHYQNSRPRYQDFAGTSRSRAGTALDPG